MARIEIPDLIFTTATTTYNFIIIKLQLFLDFLIFFYHKENITQLQVDKELKKEIQFMI